MGTAFVKQPVLSMLLFSHSVVSDSLRPHGLQHTRLPCPLRSPGACSNSCPLSRWCHPIILSCHPLLLLPSSLPSIRVFSNESAFHIRWPKYWEFQLQHQSFQWIFRTYFFRMDWLDLRAVQGALKSLLHHSSKASVLQCSAFFIVQLLYPYMTTGKTIALKMDLCWQSNVFAFY